MANAIVKENDSGLMQVAQKIIGCGQFFLHGYFFQWRNGSKNKILLASGEMKKK